MELHTLSILEITQLLETGKITPEEIFQYFRNRALAGNADLNAMKSIADMPADFSSSGPLAGIPIGVKDVFAEAGVSISAGSKMLEQFTPPYTSTVVERLKNAGAKSLGVCHMDEYAMGSSGENCAYGPSRNPWAIDRVPGGSSSGSAVAVAAWFAPASLGTDTGGSVRTPASLCGIVGFKPTYGRNSRFGVIAMASSLDCPGTFTKTVRDAALLYEVTAGQDTNDSTSLPSLVSVNPEIWKETRLDGVKVGVPKEYFRDGLDAGVRIQIEKAIETMKSLGAEIKEITLPNSEY